MSVPPRDPRPSVVRALTLLCASVALGACGGGSTSCEDHGGVKVRGVCFCPAGSMQNGETCSSLDSGSPGPDAATAAAADASSDAAPAPAPMGDGGEAGAPGDGGGDASTPALPFDASVRDGGLRCVPQGVYEITRTKLRGNCDAGLPMFQSVFHGKLSDPYTDELSCPNFDAGISDDGCVMTYVQRCDTSPTGFELETGTVSMKPEDGNTIIGNLTVSDYSTKGGTTQQLCSGEFLLGAIKQ